MVRKELKWIISAFVGTAKRLAGWDASGVPVEVAPASQSDAITGTSDTTFLTPLAAEQKRSITTKSLSNAATGSITIDCEGKQEIKIVFLTTVTGAITLTRSNDSSLETLHIIMPITGASIAITFPSDVRMSRYYEVATGNGWYQGTKILQVGSTGTSDLHEFSLIKSGSVFKLNYDGPTRA